MKELWHCHGHVLMDAFHNLFIHNNDKACRISVLKMNQLVVYRKCVIRNILSLSLQ